MPEGDTLWRTAAALHHALAGKTLSAIEPLSFRRLVGDRVDAVEAVGKHLYIRFSSGLAIHSHLRMNGSWHIYRPEEQWRIPAWRARAVLRVDDVVVVAFSTPVLELVKNDSRTERLGPDILADEFEVAEVVRRVVTAPGRAIGEVLLDQSVSAGIGNIYRCEALWEARVNPWTSVDKISFEALAEVYGSARAMMQASAYGSVRRRKTVHGRGGRPCLRCSTPIRVKRQGQLSRLTYWCPRCQDQQEGPFERS